MKTGSIRSSEQYPVIIKADNYEISFSMTGKMVSFLDANKQERLKTGDPGKSFYLLLNMQTEIPLSTLSIIEGNVLKCSSANGSQSAFFALTPRPRYCHFKLVKLEGVPTTNVLTLHFGLNSSGIIKAFDTDYMTFVINKGGPENADIEHAHHNALVTRSVSDNDIQVQFEFIWNRNRGNPLGGFALYAPMNEEQEDDIITELWVNENLPHPKVDDSWTYEKAKGWIKDWQLMFAERNQLMLEGTSLEELYEGAEIAKRAGCNEVYLFTNSWRHGFMADKELNWELRSDIYKNGESDLRAYSDYLSKNNIRLNIHYVSGGLGPGDQKYVVNPDDRLASYGEFSLVDEIGPEDTTIRVKPLDELELPFLVDDSDAYLRLPGLYRRMFGYHHLRIGGEILKVGEFQDTDGDIWTLVNCERGVNSVVSAHTHNETVKGLISAYRRMMLPDNDSTLLGEVAENYAGLLNRCKIWHTEYDGCEIHNYTGNWGFQKFAALVYQNLDHPVTSHDSGAVRPKCHIEYRLNSTRKIMEGNCSYSHGNYSIPFTLHSNSRLAVNKLDSHYTLSQGYKGGALGLAKPEPMFGVRPKDVDSHGQIDQLLDSLKTWREVAANLTSAQRKIIEDSFEVLPLRYERSKHIASRNVFVARKTNGRLSMVPTTVMTRKKGDVLWQHCQEHGAVPPKQFIKLNGSLTLENPNRAQTPKFVIRLAQNYNYEAATRSAFEFEEAAGEAAEREHEFVAGNRPETGRSSHSIDCNMLLNPKEEDFSGQSLTGVSLTGTDHVFEAENAESSDYYEAYKLPEFECRADMTEHRGIGMTITGDGSGSIFVVQIGGRDYVVPIDFTGEKYVEILNGEVAWHEGRWGWRGRTKSTRYSMINSFRTGFCHIPASTRTRIIVKEIKLLKEIRVPLKELTISNSAGSIRICGNIETDDYIEYEGGDTAVICDSNWNEKGRATVVNDNFESKTGYDTYNFSGDKSAWIEVQLITEGEEITVGSHR